MTKVVKTTFSHLKKKNDRTIVEEKHFEEIKKTHTQKKNEIARRIPILSISFYAKLDTITHVQMHVNTSKHHHLRLYNIFLNEIKIQACTGFSCVQVSCITSTSKVEKSYENKHYQNSKVFKSIKEF